MDHPVIVAVDDDRQVLRAIERDLRGHYADGYRVVTAGGGASALDAVRRLRLREAAVALFLVDQRMPEMTGIEFLEQAREIYPDAKRVLLTAYADTEVAIKAINTVDLDHYLLKPWDPPEEKLYPVIDDLLDDWHADFLPTFEGVRLVGERWSGRAHEIKDYLARNQIPYRWLDADDEASAQLIASAGVERDGAPLLFFPDGTHLVGPTNREIAEKVGLRTRATLPFYDLVIVGGGPTGLAAAVYGASEGLKTLLIEREAPGGQAGTTSRIENYLGFPVGLSGADLARRALAQASRLGAEILSPQDAVGVRVEDPYKFVQLGDGSEVSCQALLVATGVEYRKLALDGIEAITGAGVFYGAAITEAAFYRGSNVAVVGGGNSAGQAAVYLSHFASDVTLVVRGGSLESGMSQYLVDQIHATPNIAVRLKAQIGAVTGTRSLEGIRVDDSDAGTAESLPVEAMFVFIGQQPRTEWLGDLVQRDAQGFILSGPRLVLAGDRPAGWTMKRDPLFLETSVPGIFVAGDVRSTSIKRIASAVGEGSMAVAFVHQHLASL